MKVVCRDNPWSPVPGPYAGQVLRPKRMIVEGDKLYYEFKGYETEYGPNAYHVSCFVELHNHSKSWKPFAAIANLLHKITMKVCKQSKVKTNGKRKHSDKSST